MDIFIEQKNEVSGRFAIIEENGTSAWLYLMPASGKGIDRDAFVFSPIEPAEKLNIDEIKNGDTPILTKSVASESAVITNVTESELSLEWSKDGHSVAVLYKNKPIAFIDSVQKASYSKALKIESFFGKPWDQNTYNEIFK
ncbi:hypothetical protein [Shewanella sp. 38A_GOM-205m]|uniref:hypothetical protein n=1 Tax=Shewanella sp. 38A_GOM-205m TaxID=1380363 RepID=UPI0012DE57D9|nr:hypothetical protein [Shewanella sp. 38A_GOM-205m]